MMAVYHFGWRVEKRRLFDCHQIDIYLLDVAFICTTHIYLYEMRLFARDRREKMRQQQIPRRNYIIAIAAVLFVCLYVSCFAISTTILFGLSHYLAPSLRTVTDCLATIKLATDLAHATY